MEEDSRSNLELEKEKLEYEKSKMPTPVSEEEVSDKPQDYTMDRFIPPFKKNTQKKRKKKTGEKKDCPHKILILFCNHHYRPFYACFSKLYETIEDEVSRIYCKRFPDCENCDEGLVDLKGIGEVDEGCPYASDVEDTISNIIDGLDEEKLWNVYQKRYPDFKEIPALLWKKRDRYCASCRCKAVKTMEEEIIERAPITEMAKHEPCNNLRCNELQKNGTCRYQEEQIFKAQRIQEKEWTECLLPRIRKDLVV